MEAEFYSKQVFLKHSLIALIVKSSIGTHIFFLESKLCFEHMGHLETSDTNSLLEL